MKRIVYIWGASQTALEWGFPSVCASDAPVSGGRAVPDRGMNGARSRIGGPTKRPRDADTSGGMAQEVEAPMHAQRNRTPGIRARHRRTCSIHEGGRCNCTPAYEAWVFSKRDGKKIRKTFPRLAEAKLWRADAVKQLSSGVMRAPKPITIEQAWQIWHEAALAGTVRNRSGERYKPSSLRSYEKAMRRRVLPEFGAVRLVDLSRPDLQDFVERLIAMHLAASTVQVTLLPLRAIYKRAIARGELVVNPCSNVDLPSSDARRERFATPAEAGALIDAAPERDRALWATALYAGLRRGELMALLWKAVDLATGVIHVRHGWDEQEGEINLKTRSGRRRVPIIPALRDYLVDHRLLTERGDGFVFGRDADRVFDPGAVTRRADATWESAAA